MSANGTTDQTQAAAEGKRILQHMHEQGLIDLDAPMRQLFDRMDSSGDVSGYQLTSTKIDDPSRNPDQWWVYLELDSDGSGRVFAGSDLKDAGLRK